MYECQLAGDFYESFEGHIRSVTDVKRYQGIGNTSRDAKSKAATAALKKLKEFMPGVKVRKDAGMATSFLPPHLVL